MDDEQFNKMFELNKATASSVDKLAEEQKRQSDSLDEYGGQLDTLNQSVSDLKGQTDVSLTRLGTQLEGMKERHIEDGARVEKRIDKVERRADKKESELETKIGGAHQNNQDTDRELGKLAGKFSNHVEDNHATTAMQTRTDLDTHVIDDNRHSGESPGGAVKTAGIGVAGGGMIWGLIELAKAFFADS